MLAPIAAVPQSWRLECCCSKCGQQITEGSSFCNYCGEQLVRPAVQPARVEPSTDGKAIGSLICGILSVTILSLLAGIPAIILGHLSRSGIKKSMGRLKGEGMALAGLIMGYVSLAIIPFILIIAAIAIPSLLRARQAANESAAVASLR